MHPSCSRPRQRATALRLRLHRRRLERPRAPARPPPEALLLASEKQRLLPVRRRSLMILGWMAVQVRQLARAGKITERHEVMLMDHLDELSAGYHGCIKIKAQPMPFSYAQLVAMLTLIFCLTVPVTFMSSRRVRCACVQTFLRSFE